MQKLNYLNVGCGKKFHPDWVNVDMAPRSPEVQAANLIKGIPFPDNTFDVVYHSQVLEHIPKDNAAFFIRECYRVLKPGGILRVVVPDLENLIEEYRRLLQLNLTNPTEQTRADYDWILIELFDQMVRNESGGQMAGYLRQPVVPNEDYVLSRIGYEGIKTRERFLQGKTGEKGLLRKAFSSFTLFKTALGMVIEKLKIRTKNAKVGAFRLGGEVHVWMYDRFSLASLLGSCGFVEIAAKNPSLSDIPEWSSFELDVKEGMVYDPTSLFMEAKKPN